MARKKSEEPDNGQDAPPPEKLEAAGPTPASEDHAPHTERPGDATLDAAATRGSGPALPDPALPGDARPEDARPDAAEAAPDPYATDPYAQTAHRADPAADTLPADGSAPAQDPAPTLGPDDRVAERSPGDAQDEDIHDDERGSFAAKALTALVLLLLGAAIGIWAAPRIAPMLPSGMAPVANWLTPGAAGAEDEIAALEQRLDAELAALNQQVRDLPDAATLESSVDSAVDARVEAARTELASQIDDLRQTLQQADPAAIGDRVGRLEASVGGATAELASLRDQIASGAASLSADASQSIDTYRAELEGVRAQVGDLSGAVSALDGRLDAVRSEAEAEIEAAQTEAQQVQQTAQAERDLSAAQADLAAVSAAIAAGEPYADALSGLAAATGATPPASLEAGADSGVPSALELRESFGPAAHDAIRATITASAGEGMFARARAFAESQVASRSLTPRAGQDPDAVLSRMEDALSRDDVAAALEEANALPSEATQAMSDWLAAARLRADAKAGLAELSASVENTN